MLSRGEAVATVILELVCMEDGGGSQSQCLHRTGIEKRHVVLSRENFREKNRQSHVSLFASIHMHNQHRVLHSILYANDKW